MSVLVTTLFDQHITKSLYFFITMYCIDDNKFNRGVSREKPKLKIWKYAGLMLTYKCNAKCAFCYYNSGPESKGLMAVETALKAWKSLVALAGERASVHITGGEPFLFFDQMVNILTEAGKQNLSCLDSIETNAYWATDKSLIAERIGILDSLGMKRLKISWDPFHAEYVDIEPVKLLIETAEDILGCDRVLVRWEKYLQRPVKMSQLSEEQRQIEYRKALADYPIRFTGRSATKLGGLFADKSVEKLSQQRCEKSYLNAKGVHIDPYGNVFSGLCSGICIGNINEKPLEKIWSDFAPDEAELIGTLFGHGPAGLLAEAVDAGYKQNEQYSDKCHLCTSIRQFFFDNGKYNSIIRPVDCYEQSAGKMQEA